MGFWQDRDVEYAWDDLELTDIWVSENPVVATLLGPDGGVLIELRARPPIGFRSEVI